MAGKIVTIEEAASISRQKKIKGKKVILAGGCFDILHPGHIFFLNAAKKSGDVLIILLESDENIRKRKGKGRPVNSQKNRQIVVSAIENVDYVIPLTGVTIDQEYDRLMIQIKPDVIAITEGDLQTEKRKDQCKLVGAELKVVIKKIDNKSTTALINKIRN